ncbi:13510_t:CDS:1 [Funneliformis mosseae]|uniref:13510_t:CDS:1 n=1 Tax=Funneliformis mosseae TaxID=27381 RepID=A0A9N8VEB9_FUNMO|nr:13510_t:CDS:1 [Funneliformis mosseae]
MSEQLESVEEEKFESGEKLSRALTQSAPDNLTEIRFGEIFPYSGFKFSLKTLDTFFDNWRGRKALSMYACDLEYKKVEYAEIIKKYIDEGVIKEFIRGSLKDAIFDYEL